jgi:hypothetical protein
MQRFPDEIVEQMVASDRVTMRARGVIVKWLQQRDERPDDPARRPDQDAKELIDAMTAADLMTFLRPDFESYIEGVKAGKRERK